MFDVTSLMSRTGVADFAHRIDGIPWSMSGSVLTF